MKKYYDIWSNDLGIYQALLSYENKKTTDVEGSFYLGIILSTSSKNAIKEYYEVNKIQKENELTLDSSWINENIHDKLDILIAKKIREQYILCPMSIAIKIAKYFLKETNNLKTFKKLIITKDNNELKIQDWSWLEQESDGFGNGNSALFQNIKFLREPWIPFPCMFGEDISEDKFQARISDLTYKILEKVSLENKKEVINIIDEIVQESRNFNSFDN